MIARQIDVKENYSQLQIWYYLESTAMDTRNSPLYGNKDSMEIKEPTQSRTYI